MQAVIVYREIDLACLRHGMTLEFVAQASFVGILQQAGTEMRVNAHCQGDDLAGQVTAVDEPGSVHGIGPDVRPQSLP
jgi:hypothetical protein